VGWRIILEQFSEVLSQHEREISVKGIGEKAGKIAGLIKAFTGDSEQNFNMLDKEYNQAYRLFVLMFDGDFLLNTVVKRQLREMHRKIKDSYTLPDRQPKGGKEFRTVSPEMVSSENADIQQVLDFLDEMVPKMKTRELRAFRKDGFTIQYDQIQEMASNPVYKDRLIPFLGVDPRRKNIKTYLSEVGKSKLFAGIKVYPPNGFSPYDKMLVGADSIFEFCNKHRIPVVSHCSYGGFATPVKKIKVNGLIIPDGKTEPMEINRYYIFKKGLRDGFIEMVRERAAVLNHPRIWAKVLDKYENLILVLAHFGSGSEEWQEEILKMMYRFKNLYTDVSCVSDADQLNVIKKIYRENPAIRHKILYGSDFFLDLMFNDSFRQYKERMESIFGKTMFDALSIENPAGFMARWYV
jgi:predicted TIM-barrel fold metal-dependent hydrolase